MKRRMKMRRETESVKRRKRKRDNLRGGGVLSVGMKLVICLHSTKADIICLCYDQSRILRGQNHTY